MAFLVKAVKELQKSQVFVLISLTDSNEPANIVTHLEKEEILNLLMEIFDKLNTNKFGQKDVSEGGDH